MEAKNGFLLFVFSEQQLKYFFRLLMSKKIKAIDFILASQNHCYAVMYSQCIEGPTKYYRYSLYLL